ncbi:OLC1v1031906C1 [Oldenlandia corymbosa var. corymbosa]|uniref:OLC1v1031906C1 n=1 Tax=Oldenlandia corymbosa var. corymbosa TaxID=529605 RepID=A0AAV1CJP3_OLDCO|nr:OLC1v1031906C1 [Oldenlandia corymbosa var. corymbosa]
MGSKNTQVLAILLISLVCLTYQSTYPPPSPKPKSPPPPHKATPPPPHKASPPPPKPKSPPPPHKTAPPPPHKASPPPPKPKSPPPPHNATSPSPHKATPPPPKPKSPPPPHKATPTPPPSPALNCTKNVHEFSVCSGLFKKGKGIGSDRKCCSLLNGPEAASCFCKAIKLKVFNTPNLTSPVAIYKVYKYCNKSPPNGFKCPSKP